MNSEPKKILFICGTKNATPFSEFIPIANLLIDKGFNSTFLLEKNASPELIDKILSNKHSLFIEDQFIHTKKTHQKQKSTASNTSNKFQQTKKFLKRIIYTFPFYYLYQIKQYYDFKKELDKFHLLTQSVFNKLNPDLIIVYGDRTLGFTPCAMAEAKKRNIPSIDMEIAINDIGFLAKDRLNSPLFSATNLLNLYWLKKYPNLSETVQNKKVLFYPWYIFKSLEEKGMMPKDPWYAGQSWADIHLMTSNLNKETYEKKNKNTKNISVIGQISLDKLFETKAKKEKLKPNLLHKYFPNETKNKPLIVFGMPQFFEHNLMPQKKADESIKKIMHYFKKLNEFQFLLSLHPKMAFKDYEYCNNFATNIKLLNEERLSEALPLSDMYITCFGSTISWAIRCEIIPVFLDYFDMNFDFTNQYKSCVTLNDFDNLPKDIQTIWKNKNNYIKNVKKEQKQFQPFDGKAGERLVQILKNTSTL